MRLHLIVEAWQAVRATRSRLAKNATMGDLLTGAEPANVSLAVSYLSGELPQGRIGLGYATVGSVAADPAADSTLTLADIDGALTRIQQTVGKGSKGAKEAQLREVLAQATLDEQDFLRRLLLGELRQGALGGVMTEAVARAAGIDAGLVRRAAMLSGDLPLVARRAMDGGAEALGEFKLQIFTALQPMLAQSAPDVEAALRKTGPAAVEWKIDGARVQIHKHHDQVRVFTRKLRDITSSVPDVVRAAHLVSADQIILDGEAIALDTAGRPVAFQETMSRFSADADGELDVIFFDCLHIDGRDLIDAPASERWDAMAAVVPTEMLVNRITASDPIQAHAFFDEAITSGHEGVMVKSLSGDYAAGRRGAAWVKVKPVHTFDLVVLAVEWGSGRRKGFLSNIHLGARDPDDSSKFIMVGKTFKGMTDETLAWQTKRFLELETRRTDHVVHVRPEQVVEIAIDGVQVSSRYPGGIALRFARVKGYRDDKGASDADTIDALERLQA